MAPGAARCRCTASSAAVGETTRNRCRPEIFQDGPPGGNPALSTPIIGQKVRDYDIVNVQEDFNSHAALCGNDNHPFRTATTGGAGIGSGLNTMSNFSFSDEIDRVRWASNSNTDGNNLTAKGSRRPRSCAPSGCARAAASIR